MNRFSPEASHTEPMEMDSKLFTATLKALLLPTVICAAGMTLFFSLPASAQSFSCEKAEKSAEFAICNSENLLTLDEEIGRVFTAKFVSASTTPQRQAVTREQARWIRKRNACGNDFTCLSLRYQERLKSLSNRSS